MKSEDVLAVQNGVKLFKEVFKKDISEESFNHKHFDNPTRMETPYIIEYEDGIPVAMRWMMCLDFLYCNNSLRGVQSSDDAVISKKRGLLFLKIKKKCVNMILQENVSFEYGCFMPGESMQIAEKTGEKNIVDLYTARLYLNETGYRWHRFPLFISNCLLKLRKRKLERIGLKATEIQISNTNPFSDDDYEVVNDNAFLHIKRSADYYNWKTSDLQNLNYITARKNGKLIGFLIIMNEKSNGVVIDWDVCNEEKSDVLASMFLSICDEYHFIDIPHINADSGEMKAFTDIGSKDLRYWWSTISICAKPFDDSVKEIVTDPKKWKHRLIDTDYFLNR